MTKVKVMTWCQGHNFARNMILKFCLYFDEKGVDQVPVCFYVKNGILMRKWHPPDVLAEDQWTVNHQTVVPRFIALKFWTWPMTLPWQVI